MFRKLKKELMAAAGAVDDTRAAGQLSGHFEGMDSESAVAQMLSPGAAAFVEIGIEACNLPDRDFISKSDAMAVLFTAENPKSKNWTEVGRTDTIANSLSPKFTKPVRTTFKFEKLQPMRLLIFDVDDRKKDNAKLKLDDQDFLAQAEFVLSNLLTAKGQTLRLQMLDRHGNRLGLCTATLTAEELPNVNALVELHLSAHKLDNKDTFGKSDPFLRVSKARSSVAGEWRPVLRTEVVDNDLNPVWKPVKASMAQLCNCDENRKLLLEVLDHDLDGSHDLIGVCETSLAGLRTAAQQGFGLPLINPKKQKKVSNYVNSGMLYCKGLSVQPRPSFLEYIRGGVELSFIVAVDYTASNGDPRDRNSLHYLQQYPTMYEDAIQAVGRVLEYFDTDKQFPAFGFGALLPTTGQTSHCFALNGNPHNPEVPGVQGIVQAYRQALSTVRLSGPTLFAPIINMAAQIAAQHSPRPKYHVLLILTDGCIMDMSETLQAVVNASKLPLSLLIVGVGNEDFAAMEKLDGDKKRVKAPDGTKAARDCVQFVELRPHKQRDSVEGLAAKLLAELPGQLVQYFHDIACMPPPPPMHAPVAPPPAAAMPMYAPPSAGGPPMPPPMMAAPPPATAAVHNAGYPAYPGTNAPPAAPTAPATGGWPAAAPQQPAPAASTGAYPGYATSGYPPAPGGYPAPTATTDPHGGAGATGGYPPAPAGYPAPTAAPDPHGGAGGGWPAAVPHAGYPPAAAPQTPAHTGYPPANPGYPNPGYPPANAPGYPPANAYPTI